MNWRIEQRSACVAATPTADIYDSVANAITPTGITDARTAVNAVRAAAGLTAFSFTDSSLSGQPVRAIRVREFHRCRHAGLRG